MESRSGKENEFTNTSEESQTRDMTDDEDRYKEISPRLSFIISSYDGSSAHAKKVASTNMKKREYNSYKSIEDTENKKESTTKPPSLTIAEGMGYNFMYFEVNVLKVDEASEHTRKFYHTIICIDTSKSMRASKQTTNSCIRQLLREIPEQNQEFEEIISVVCFGKDVRVYKYVFEYPMGHIQFITEELENQVRSLVGCTPLCAACGACISLHATIKEEVIRRIGIPVFLKGRIVMFSDGKCTSTTARHDVDDENYDPMEPMESIHDNLQNVWTRCRLENLPIFCIISSYHDTDQNFLVTMSVCTNGKIILQDEISTFAKFIDIEINARRFSRECRNFNWHQVFAYLRLNLGHQDMLYYDYATELISRMNKQNINFCNHNGLPRLIRRYPKQGIFGWQEKNHLRDWVYFSTEISDEIEKGYCNRREGQLETYTIERQNINQEIDVLRFDFKNFSYRIIGDQRPHTHIRRTFIGNDWG